MGLTYQRVLYRASLKSGDTMSLPDALDLGERQQVVVVVTVETAGNADDTGQFVMQHAAVNEVDGYLDFQTPMTVPLNVTGRTWFSADAFTRWVSWTVTGNLSSPAVVTVDLLAKS